MDSSDCHAHPFSLRFQNPDLECGFVASRRPLLVRRFQWLLSLFSSSSCCLLLFALARGSEGFKTAVARESATAQVVGEGALLVTVLLFLAALCFRSGRTTFRSHLALEAAVCAQMLLGMTVILFCAPKRYAKLRGHALAEAFESGYDSDSSLLLTLDGFVTASHLGLPLRWCVLAPLELAALLLYALNVGLVGTEEPVDNVFMNFLVLGLLVVAAACAKRMAEADERRSFVVLINERRLRCEAEFQLSQGDRGKASGRSEDSSEPVTDRSGAVFETFMEGNKGEQLEGVAGKGEEEHWRIPAQEVRLLREDAIGKGSFGSVRRAVFCGMLVAVKCPHSDVEKVRLPELCNELRVLRHLRHPHIVAVHGAVVLPEQERLYLVLELVEGVDLKSFVLPRSQEPSVLARYQVMVGVCQAMLYMHTRKPHVVHGDIKCSNVMVALGNGRAIPKLLDFGLSRVVNRRSRPLGGTLAWMAPEVAEHGPVRCSADIFSLGNLLVFVATGQQPMQGMRPRRILRALRSQLPVPDFPEGCAFQELRPLAQACLRRQQAQRPRALELYEGLLRLAPGLQLPPGALGSLEALASDLAGPDLRELAATSRRRPPLEAVLSPLPEEEVVTPAVQPPAAQPPAAQPAVRSLSAPAHPYPERPATCRTARVGTLLAALQRWNCPLANGCCETGAALHAALELAMAELEGGHCCGRKLARPAAATQCEYCGVLGVAAGLCCDLCGWQARAAPAGVETPDCTGQGSEASLRASL